MGIVSSSYCIVSVRDCLINFNECLCFHLALFNEIVFILKPYIMTSFLINSKDYIANPQQLQTIIYSLFNIKHYSQILPEIKSLLINFLIYFFLPTLLWKCFCYLNFYEHMNKKTASNPAIYWLAGDAATSWM